MIETDDFLKEAAESIGAAEILLESDSYGFAAAWAYYAMLYVPVFPWLRF